MAEKASKLQKRVSLALRILAPKSALESTVSGPSDEGAVAGQVISSGQLAGVQKTLEDDPGQIGLVLDLLSPAAIGDKDPKRVALELVSAGQEAFQRIADTGNAEDLTATQVTGLEAIVRVVGRPSFLIQNAKFKKPDGEWAFLEDGGYISDIEKTIRSVGRIELKGHPENLSWVGTGWVGGTDIIVTNRHVAREFALKDGDTWKLNPNISVWIDLLAEEGNPESNEYEVTDVVALFDDPDPDVALLRVRTKDRKSVPLPPPLPIAANEQEVDLNEHVYTVGYPGFDPRHKAASLKHVFAGIYGRKRFAPGEAISFDKSEEGVALLRHDCSTLKGASGSCILRLGTHKVVGLHYEGTESVENRSVLLASYREDKRLKSASLHFVP